MYIDSDFKYEVLEKTSNEAFQALWVEIHFTNAYPLPLSTPATQARNKLSNVRSFIILLFGEGLTSFSVNNRI